MKTTVASSIKQMFKGKDDSRFLFSLDIQGVFLAPGDWGGGTWGDVLCMYCICHCLDE